MGRTSEAWPVLLQLLLFSKSERFEALSLILDRDYLFAIRSWDRYNYTGPYSSDFRCRSPGPKGDRLLGKLLLTGDRLLFSSVPFVSDHTNVNDWVVFSVPSAPRSVSIQVMNSTAVQIFWDPPVVGSTPALVYTVYVTASWDTGSSQEATVNGTPRK